MNDLERAELKLELTEALADVLEEMAESEDEIISAALSGSRNLLQWRLGQLNQATRLRTNAAHIEREIKFIKARDAAQTELVEGI